MATENGAFDAEVYRYLLQCILQTPVTTWSGDRPVRFNGWKSVVKQAPIFLKLAEQAKLRHALLAIDNDGGSRRHPEHQPDHDVKHQAADEDGCRVCKLMNIVPDSWEAAEFRRCVVVPVQTIETWLLVARGDTFNAPTPEQYYHRSVIKKKFFGCNGLPETVKTEMALEVLGRADVLGTLRLRRSFQHFEQQLASWKA